MNVSKEEILHIAELANLKLDEKEIPEYIKNLQDILNYANIVNKVSTEELENYKCESENYNVFRKDKVEIFEDNKALLQNAPEKEDNMFKIPNVL